MVYKSFPVRQLLIDEKESRRAHRKAARTCPMGRNKNGRRDVKLAFFFLFSGATTRESGEGWWGLYACTRITRKSAKWNTHRISSFGPWYNYNLDIASIIRGSLSIQPARWRFQFFTHKFPGKTAMQHCRQLYRVHSDGKRQLVLVWIQFRGTTARKQIRNCPVFWLPRNWSCASPSDGSQSFRGTKAAIIFIHRWAIIPNWSPSERKGVALALSLADGVSAFVPVANTHLKRASAEEREREEEIRV